MKTKLIKIGNGRGIRLTNSLIERAELGDENELEASGDEIVVRPLGRKPRAGWAASCKAMHAAGDDKLIDGPLPSLTSFDEEEWEW